MSQVRGIYGPFLLFSFLGGKLGTYLEICIAYLATLVLLSGDLQQPVPAVERVLPPGGLPPRQEDHIQDKGPGKCFLDFLKKNHMRERISRSYLMQKGESSGCSIFFLTQEYFLP